LPFGTFLENFAVYIYFLFLFLLSTQQKKEALFVRLRVKCTAATLRPSTVLGMTAQCDRRKPPPRGGGHLRLGAYVVKNACLSPSTRRVICHSELCRTMAKRFVKVWAFRVTQIVMSFLSFRVCARKYRECNLILYYLRKYYNVLRQNPVALLRTG
jgi:hypothetical protein